MFINLILGIVFIIFGVIGIGYIIFGIVETLYTFRLKKEYNIIEIDQEDPVMKRLAQHYQYLIERGYDVVCLCLQGSQNYGLDEYSKDYKSDVDSKAIILPTFKDYVNELPPISETIVLDNNEHIDVKDIRVMFEMFKKQNISYIELLFTKYKIINPKYAEMIKPIFEERESIAAAHTNQFVRCIAGMSMEKKKALCHPYPSIAAKIEKYGFDGKQLSHCARLNNFLYKWMNNVAVADCFNADNKEMLMNFKKQLVADGSRTITKEEAIELCEKYDNDTRDMKEMILRSHAEMVNTEIYDMLNRLKYDILKSKFEEDIWKKEK